jgi:pyruvate/2-oxoglutarate dehydrogenase complex dihydrolipoamide dehydrogenase (E3) component
MTTPMKQFDAIIIGTGQAGPPLASRFASAGMEGQSRLVRRDARICAVVP